METPHSINLNITLMSGVEDGSLMQFNSQEDGEHQDHGWVVTIGRGSENDLCMRYDTFVSRKHARLHLRDNQWWLEDCDSTNGTFIENAADAFIEERVQGTIPLPVKRLFRIGRTWMRLEPTE